MTDQPLRRLGEINGHRHDQKGLCGSSGSHTHTFKQPHSADTPKNLHLGSALVPPIHLRHLSPFHRWLADESGQGEQDDWCHKMGVGRGSQSVFLGCETDARSPCKLTGRWSGLGQSPGSRAVVSSLYRDVEGSFLTRLWARKELSMGFSSGGGWEFFRAE